MGVISVSIIMDSENHTPLTLTEQQAKANFHHLVMDIVWFAVAFPATSRFLSVYAIRLDASPTVLGLLSALPALVAMLTSALARRWRVRYADTSRAVSLPGLGFRLVFLLPVFTPLMPSDWQPLWLVVAVTVPALAQGISSVLFLVLMREAVGPSKVTALLSRRSMMFNITLAVSTLGLGFWLEQVTFPANYQIMFLAAFAVSLMSWWHVTRVRVLPSIDVPRYAQLHDTPPVRALRSPAMLQVGFVTVLAHLSFFMLAPVIPLWLVDGLGAGESYMSFFALAELGAAAVIAAYVHRLIRHFGSQTTIAVGLFGTALSAALLAGFPSLIVALPAGALSGASWTLAAVSLFGYFNDNTPDDSVTRYTTVYNQVAMLAMFIGPLLGSQLAGTSLDLTAVLGIGMVLRLLASGLVQADVAGRVVRRAGRSRQQTVFQEVE
ncbi:MAG: MFS transporter [Anaerolineae bacterium]|nr:MFS transporter [Anaerolineae bacterium]